MFSLLKDMLVCKMFNFVHMIQKLTLLGMRASRVKYVLHVLTETWLIKCKYVVKHAINRTEFYRSIRIREPTNY